MADLKSFTPIYSFPYPLPGDSVQNTYARIQELAERIEATYTTLGINLDSATALLQAGDAAGGDLTGTYPNPTITTSAVTTSKINDQAVTTAKIADLNVTTGKIANDAVTTAKLAVIDLKDGSTAVTQPQSDGSTKVATTAYVDAYITGTIPDGSISTAELADGAVTNVKVNASAAIAYSKLNLAGSIVNADVATGAAIAYSKLALTGSITEADLSFSVATQSELDTVAGNAATALSNHESDTTSIHGISDTANLVYTNDSRLTDSRTPTGGAGGVLSGSYPNPGFAVDMATQSELDNHASDTTSVHGIADTSVLATSTDVSTAVSTHAAVTTSVHGISNTANLVYTNDSRLSDARTPTVHAGTHVPGGSDVLDYSKIVGYGTVLPTFNATNHPAGVLWVVNTVGEPYSLYRSDGTAFKQVGGGGSITVSDTAPSPANSGALWYDSTTGKTFIYYADGSSSQWVEVGEASQLSVPGHGSSHVRGGSDIIDGDRLTIDYVPTRYTRNSAASGAGDNTDLTAHLSGIDTLAGQGHIVCTSTTRPSTPTTGTMIYETDTGFIVVYNGSTWVQMMAPASPPAMQLINPTSVVNATNTNGAITFSAQSTISVNGCFSTTFDSYRIILKTTSGSGVYCNMRLRASGTDEASAVSNYYRYTQAYTGINVSTFYGSANQGSSSASNLWQLHFDGTSAGGFGTIDLYGPANAVPTFGNNMYSYGQGGPSIYNVTGGLYHGNSVAYDGFTLYPASSTITGTLRIYGYRNAI